MYACKTSTTQIQSQQTNSTPMIMGCLVFTIELLHVWEWHKAIECNSNKRNNQIQEAKFHWETRKNYFIWFSLFNLHFMSFSRFHLNLKTQAIFIFTSVEWNCNQSNRCFSVFFIFTCKTVCASIFFDWMKTWTNWIDLFLLFCSSETPKRRHASERSRDSKKHQKSSAQLFGSSGN